MPREFSTFKNDRQPVLNRINLIRTQNNLNQDQLAKSLNISQAAVSKYLKQRIPPADILLKLAYLGKTTIEWILTGEKRHFYTEHEDTVHEETTVYGADADVQLARKIAALNPAARQLLMQLIELLERKVY